MALRGFWAGWVLGWFCEEGSGRLLGRIWKVSGMVLEWLWGDQTGSGAFCGEV